MLSHEDRERLRQAVAVVQRKREKKARRLGLGGDSRPGWEHNRGYCAVRLNRP